MLAGAANGADGGLGDGIGGEGPKVVTAGVGGASVSGGLGSSCETTGGGKGAGRIVVITS